MSTLTDRDARTLVINSLTTYVDDFDVDAIVSELHELCGHWDFDKVDSETFWSVVSKHDRS